MCNLPLLGITAYSGTGKTTLLKQLIPLLKQQGINCGIIKHTHHDMDVDTPGKDSYQLRKAGANQTLVASNKRWALMTEKQIESAPNLPYLANQFDKKQTDLILVEGFKNEAISKIVLYRAGLKQPLEALLDSHVIAIACDKQIKNNLHYLDINDPLSIAEFIKDWYLKQKNPVPI